MGYTYVGLWNKCLEIMVKKKKKSDGATVFVHVPTNIRYLFLHLLERYPDMHIVDEEEVSGFVRYSLRALDFPSEWEKKLINLRVSYDGDDLQIDDIQLVDTFEEIIKERDSRVVEEFFRKLFGNPPDDDNTLGKGALLN